MGVFFSQFCDVAEVANYPLNFGLPTRTYDKNMEIKN
jgi:hypothetical protein